MNSDLARDILAKCKTLADADERLIVVSPSRAFRWGLFDGWSGRPRTVRGLAHQNSGKVQWRKVKDDYREGCEVGRRLALDEVPA